MSGKHRWFNVRFDEAAGKAMVSPVSGGKTQVVGGIPHKIPSPTNGNFVGSYPEPQVKEILRGLAGKSRFAVFTAIGQSPYIEEVNSLSGNYRGSGHHPFRCAAEFETEEEAEEFLVSLSD